MPQYEEAFFDLDALYDWDPEYAGPWTFVCDGTNEHDEDGAYYERPCPTCTVDGKPTGRRTVPWAQAVLDARPREATRGRDRIRL